MSLKHAVLALLSERRGYGYDLVQRFHERVGPGWQLNPSAVYPALDELERAGLVSIATRRGGTRRSPRVAYAATPAGARALDAWRRTTVAKAEPVRSDLHLRLAFAGEAPDCRGALLAQLGAHEHATAVLLERCATPSDATAERRLIDAAVAARLRAELRWLRTARETLGALPD